MLIHIFHLVESFPKDMKSFHVVGLFQAGPQLGVVGDNTVAAQDTTSSKMQRSEKSFTAKRNGSLSLLLRLLLISTLERSEKRICVMNMR